MKLQSYRLQVTDDAGKSSVIITKRSSDFVELNAHLLKSHPTLSDAYPLSLLTGRRLSIEAPPDDLDQRRQALDAYLATVRTQLPFCNLLRSFFASSSVTGAVDTASAAALPAKPDDSDGSAILDGGCSDCDCRLFVAHKFKQNQCNVCYHERGRHSLAAATTDAADLPASQASSSSRPSATAINGGCDQCDCTSFVPHAFKKTTCNNCYHIHPGISLPTIAESVSARPSSNGSSNHASLNNRTSFALAEEASKPSIKDKPDSGFVTQPARGNVIRLSSASSPPPPPKPIEFVADALSMTTIPETSILSRKESPVTVVPNLPPGRAVLPDDSSAALNVTVQTALEAASRSDVPVSPSNDLPPLTVTVESPTGVSSHTMSVSTFLTRPTSGSDPARRLTATLSRESLQRAARKSLGSFSARQMEQLEEIVASPFVSPVIAPVTPIKKVPARQSIVLLPAESSSLATAPSSRLPPRIQLVSDASHDSADPEPLPASRVARSFQDGPVRVCNTEDGVTQLERPMAQSVSVTVLPSSSAEFSRGISVIGHLDVAVELMSPNTSGTSHLAVPVADSSSTSGQRPRVGSAISRERGPSNSGGGRNRDGSISGFVSVGAEKLIRKQSFAVLAELAELEVKDTANSKMSAVEAAALAAATESAEQLAALSAKKALWLDAAGIMEVRTFLTCHFIGLPPPPPLHHLTHYLSIYQSISLYLFCVSLFSFFSFFLSFFLLPFLLLF